MIKWLELAPAFVFGVLAAPVCSPASSSEGKTELPIFFRIRVPKESTDQGKGPRKTNHSNQTLNGAQAKPILGKLLFP